MKAMKTFDRDGGDGERRATYWAGETGEVGGGVRVVSRSVAQVSAVHRRDGSSAPCYCVWRRRTSAAPRSGVVFVR